MRALLLLVKKDLKRKARAPLGLLIMLLFPLIFSAMIALVFGRQGNAIPKTRLLVENLDGDAFLARTMVASLTSEQMGEYFDVRLVHAEGADLMEKGEASALLRIPAGFTQSVMDGKPVSLALVRNPSEGILPEIAEQATRIFVEVLDGGSRVLRGPLDRLRPFIGDDARDLTDEGLTAITVAVKHTIEGASTFLTPPAITLEGAFDMSPAKGAAKDAEKKDAGKKGAGKKDPDSVSQIFLFILPGVAVYSLFFVGDQGMRDLLTEAVAGTLKRQIAGPIGVGTILLGKAAFAAILALLALVVLSIVGMVAAGARADPAGFVLLSLGLIVAITGAAATVYGLARSERQGATLSSMIYLVLAFLGGSFMPIESLPASVRAIAPVSPFYWGSQGYRALIADGATALAILPNAAVLAGLGALLLAIGARALRRTVHRGVSPS